MGFSDRLWVFMKRHPNLPMWLALAALIISIAAPIVREALA